MSRAIDIRKPRVACGSPKVKHDYAHVPRRPATRIQWVKAYVAVILSGVMIVGTVGTLVYMGNKLGPSRDAAGNP